ncbi:pyridoxal phosphate-dependent transferase [Lasiosphaeria hispida]|uniref:Pyridoxal phosphate-dependent transferase n=1 Tax=Lasiosphaeria hispida TaxID=260671 RepID=A0AAJ0HSB3_9PEZI|nr:pyridoxal phosphate-dependent transferase [Lasiosphaeria hispida]
MPPIHLTHPEYPFTARLDHLRSTDYPHLDAADHVYLDYTGAGLASRSQHLAHEARVSHTLYGNPHSVNPTSAAATHAVEATRARILAHFNACPDEYAVVFTANATGAARLVGESYPFRRAGRLVLTGDNHNSINGLREFARAGKARTVYVPVKAPDLRVDGADVVAALPRRKRLRDFLMPGCGAGPEHDGRPGRNGLFAYPAQSNFSGVRHPLAWVEMAQGRGYDVLLDAAAYLPTAMLDLSVVKPEFVCVSWYKLFGYPTGVGCLIAKREALDRLKRPWFSGGTIQAVSVGAPWHRMVKGGEAFEDGTLNFQSIPDVHVGLDWLATVGMPVIETRVRCLTGWFLDRLKEMRHSDGSPMITIYGPTDLKMRGGTVAFNFLDATGKVVDERLVAFESAAAMISLRTGCFCNPGAGESAFNVDPNILRSLPRDEAITLDAFIARLRLPSAGAIRVSFGVASNTRDVDKFFGFAEKTYKDRVTTSLGLPFRDSC